MKRFLAPLLLAFLMSASLWPYISSPELPLTHDSQNHIARFANFYLAIKEGQFPPRWAPNLNNGFGYPVFNFNYPLANFFVAPLIALNVPIQASYLWLSFLMTALGTLGMYFLIREYTREWSSFIGALLYFYSPYLANLLFVRGVIGELVMFGLLPWLFLMVKKVLESSRVRWWAGLILLASGYLLSHNVLAYFGLPLLLLYVLYLSKQSDKRGFNRLLTAGSISLLLVAFFWFPAMLEQSQTTLADVSISDQFEDHYIDIEQLVSDDHRVGFSLPGPVDGINFSIGYVHILGLMILLALGIRKKRINSFLIPSMLLYFFLQLPQSNMIWKLIPFGSMVQFPWRMEFFLAFLVPIFISTQLPKSKTFSTVAVVLVILVGLPRFDNPDEFLFPDDYWLTFSQTTSVLDENMPISFRKFRAYEYKEAFDSLAGVMISSSSAGTVEHQSWNGSVRKYKLILTEPATISEATAYFSGWRVIANTTSLDVFPNDAGLLSYHLDPGTYEIQSYFSQRTWPRLVGNGLSLAGIAIFGYQLLRRRRPDEKT